MTPEVIGPRPVPFDCGDNVLFGSGCVLTVGGAALLFSFFLNPRGRFQPLHVLEEAITVFSLNPFIVFFWGVFLFAARRP